MSKSSFQQEIPFKGDSMSPLIKDGDKVVVDLYAQPKPICLSIRGKICFYNDGSEWVTHRVLKFDHETYIKGDFSKSFDNNSQLNIWGEIRQVKTPRGRTINFKKNSQYDLLCEKLSVAHMTCEGLKAKSAKLMLYILNTVRRIFSFYNF